MLKILTLNHYLPRLIRQPVKISVVWSRIHLFVRALLFIYFGIGSLAANALDCPDMKKAQYAIKEIQQLINNDLCAKGIKEQQVAWIRKTVLPQIMTKSFLEVEPPANWSMMADELFGCYTTGNLCSKKVQEQFAQCSLVLRMPIVSLRNWIFCRLVLNGVQPSMDVALNSHCWAS